MLLSHLFFYHTHFPALHLLDNFMVHGAGVDKKAKSSIHAPHHEDKHDKGPSGKHEIKKSSSRDSLKSNGKHK